VEVVDSVCSVEMPAPADQAELSEWGALAMEACSNGNWGVVGEKERQAAASSQIWDGLGISERMSVAVAIELGAYLRFLLHWCF